MPQLYLGISFGGGACRWPLRRNRHATARGVGVVHRPLCMWACIYDTMYAMVDREDDLKIGVKSSAILFADMDKLCRGHAGDDAVRAGARRAQHDFGEWY